MENNNPWRNRNNQKTENISKGWNKLFYILACISLVIIGATIYSFSTGKLESMTLVDMPNYWTEKDGQRFIDKMDMRKLQYAVSKKFPSVVGRKVTFKVLPLVFNSSIDNSVSYKFQVKAASEDGWSETDKLKEFIAQYIKKLLFNGGNLTPVVLVDLPNGMDEIAGDKFIRTIDGNELKSAILKKFPEIKNKLIHMKILPVALKPNDLMDRSVKLHVMVISESNWNDEYNLEVFIGEFLKARLPKN